MTRMGIAQALTLKLARLPVCNACVTLTLAKLLRWLNKPASFLLLFLLSPFISHLHCHLAPFTLTLHLSPP
jgi:hypothetical protein